MTDTFNRFKMMMDSMDHKQLLQELYNTLETTMIDPEISYHFHPSVSINQFWWSRTKVLISMSEILRKVLNNIY